MIELLKWYNLIFLLPLVVSALLLLLSSIVSMANGDGEGDADTGDGEHDGNEAEGEKGDDSSDEDTDGEEEDARESKTDTNILFTWLGVGKAPFSLLVNVFWLTWGIVGLTAIRVLSSGSGPSPMAVTIAAAIALAVALVMVRCAAEFGNRLLPKAETRVLSRQGLFGLTGRVLFRVTETTGRIRVYDEHRTMHEERCRVADGGNVIEKGRFARIIDVDAEGRLIVEETPEKPAI